MSLQLDPTPSTPLSVSPPSGRVLDRQHRVETPEHVRLDFALADLGSRFAAQLFDFVIIIGGLILLFLPALLTDFVEVGRAIGIAGLAVVTLAAFCLQWGYFVCFEAFWGGRTPGKRLLGLRVLHDGGQPLTFQGAVVRNLLRGVDLQPFWTGALGGMVMMLGPRTQRLGDMAAGTIVVRDEGNDSVLWDELPEERVLGRPRLSADQFQVLEQYCLRRESLPAAARRRVSGTLAQRLAGVVNDHPLFRTVSDDEFFAVLYEEERPRQARNATSMNRQVTQLIREQRDAWSAYRGLLDRGRKRGLTTLTEEELASFGRLYRGVMADLARARSYGASGSVVLALENLAGKGHNLLYAASAESVGSIRRWVFEALPGLVRKEAWLIILSAVLLFGSMAASFAAVRETPRLARSLVPSGMLTRVENTRHGDIDAEYIDVPSALTPLFSSQILTNNLRVAFAVFAGGAAAGMGTVLMLLINGISLGAVFGLYANEGVLPVILAFVSPHGVMELSAIVLAGGAGLRLGAAILVPGRRTRRSALEVAGRRALSLVGASVLLLLMAGVVEGFYSPSDIRAVYKYAFGGVTAVFLVLYFGLVGREAGPAEGP